MMVHVWASDSAVVLTSLRHNLFMWPFSSPRNPYRQTIEAKRARRAEAIELAPPFKPEEHQKYLNATGNCAVLHFSFTASACSPPNLATRC
jgi:hypothetical protein